jgi:hypothetical protein
MRYETAGRGGGSRNGLTISSDFRRLYNIMYAACVITLLELIASLVESSLSYHMLSYFMEAL